MGLNPEDHGLLGIWPEYVERLTLDNKINPELPYEWYKVAVLYDNDFMMFFYLDRLKIFDEEVQQWLADQIDEEIPLMSSDTASALEES